MKAAIIELNHYHDEILPTLVYCLNRLGVAPDVYVPRRAARNNAFAFTNELRYRLRLTDGLARLRGTPARFSRYDLLVMNSIEPASVLRSAVRFREPTLAIVHNAGLLEEDEYLRYFDAPVRRPLVLGRHIAANLAPDMVDSWVAPVFMGDVPRPRQSGTGAIRLCVQGNVEFKRRDYGSLIAALAEISAERAGLQVRVVGRSGYSDGEAVRKMVRDRGLADVFSFSDDELSHSAFRSLVADSDFILPLLDPETGTLVPYYKTKLTSSMSMAVGIGVIPVSEAHLAKLYQVDRAAVTYPAGGLASGIREAMSLSTSERADRERNLADIREDVLQASVRNFAAALQRINV